MSNPGLKTLSVAVANLRYSANAAAEWHIMAAGASIALLPILIVYLFANRQFITGLTGRCQGMREEGIPSCRNFM